MKIIQINLYSDCRVRILSMCKQTDRYAGKKIIKQRKLNNLTKFPTVNLPL